MFRTLLAALLALTLSGCWMSQEPLFTPDDYAQVEVAGVYLDKMGTMSQDGVVKHELNRDPDNRIRWTVTSLVETGDPERPPIETTENDWIALVEIPETAPGWYIAITFKVSGKQEPIYHLVSHDEDGGIRWFQANCLGTKIRSGMIISPEASGLAPNLCEFNSKEALFSAARDAVDFLSSEHPVQIVPLAYFTPAPRY